MGWSSCWDWGAYYLNLWPFPSWIMGLLTAWPVALASAAGWVIPFNQWRAYGEVNAKDGAIFAVFFLFGPFWAAYFYFYHSLLLAPLSGLVMIFATAGLLATLQTWSKRRGQTIIPAWVWALVFAPAGLALTWLQGGSLFQMWLTGGMMAILIVALARRRLHVTFWGLVGLCLALLLLLGLLRLNL